MTHQANNSPIPPDRDPFEGTPFKTQCCLASGAIGEIFIVEHCEVLAEIALHLDTGNEASGVIRTPQALADFSSVPRCAPLRRRGYVPLYVFVALAMAFAWVLLGLWGDWMKP